MKHTTRSLIYPKLCTISPENKPPEEETPEELSPEVESFEEKKYLKLRDLDILFKYTRNMG
jgi:hypothetical protein